MAIASAPGKILWLGGYAILEKDCVGLVTAVDKRVYAEAREAKGDAIEFSMPQFGISASGKFSRGELKLTKGKGAEWKRIAEFSRQACEAALCYAESKGAKPRGMRITTKSDPAFGSRKGGKGKSGLGSSAALVVSVVAAVLQLHGFAIAKEKNREAIHKLAQYAHSRAQGKVGSGFDVASAAYGTCIYARYSPEMAEGSAVDAASRAWDCIIRPLKMPKQLVLAYGNIVGNHASTTEMVHRVMEWKGKEPRAYAELMREMDNADVTAIRALEAEDLLEFRHAVERAREVSRELGNRSGAPVEPPELMIIMDASLMKGAVACRLPGAGGYDAVAALCLGEKWRARVEKFWKSVSPGIRPLRLEIGKEGVRAERKIPTMKG